jgi:predicted helicase
LDINYVFPLYLYPATGELDNTEQRRPNLNTNIVDKIAAKISLRFTDEKEANSETFAPIDILDYIYAVLYSQNFRAKYQEFLKIDFPRVPYPEDAETFQNLAALGATLRRIHLLDGVEPTDELAAYPIEGSNIIEKVEYKDNKVWINKTQYFESIAPEVANFFVGGYQPALKWLKDRKAISYEDIRHYQKVVAALHLTIAIQGHIDEYLD